MKTKYRIVPKRDWGSGPGFYDKGEWVRHGFIVTDGFCNIMPAAIWFRDIPSAFAGLKCFIAAQGVGKDFWRIWKDRAELLQHERREAFH